jgi:hypothetical protein
MANVASNTKKMNVIPRIVLDPEDESSLCLVHEEFAPDTPSCIPEVII